MKIRGMRVGQLLLALALVIAIYGVPKVKAQTGPTTPSQDQFQTLIYSIKGPDLFQAYCASCHGSSGKGDGPVAPALKAKMPDLTVLSKNNKGMFPTARIRKVILGDEVMAAHGSRAMPIWGPIFHQIERDQDFGNVRIENLIKYLQSIQQN